MQPTSVNTVCSGSAVLMVGDLPADATLLYQAMVPLLAGFASPSERAAPTILECIRWTG